MLEQLKSAIHHDLEYIVCRMELTYDDIMDI